MINLQAALPKLQAQVGYFLGLQALTAPLQLWEEREDETGYYSAGWNTGDYHISLSMPRPSLVRFARVQYCCAKHRGMRRCFGLRIELRKPTKVYEEEEAKLRELLVLITASAAPGFAVDPIRRAASHRSAAELTARVNMGWSSGAFFPAPNDCDVTQTVWLGGVLE